MVKKKKTHIPAKAIRTAACNIIPFTSNSKIDSIITAWGRTPFRLHKIPNKRKNNNLLNNSKSQDRITISN